jgi:hypothetical protein
MRRDRFSRANLIFRKIVRILNADQDLYSTKGNIMPKISMRTLGRSGIEVSPMGLGCWAIGGPFRSGETPLGWGEVDDEESIRAIRAALELGLNFFDTANVYGAGHSERVLSRALSGMRGRVVIATKFNSLFDETSKQVTGSDSTPYGIRKACEDSLRRLNTDYIDLYQFHDNGFPTDKAEPRGSGAGRQNTQVRLVNGLPGQGGSLCERIRLRCDPISAQCSG